MQIGWRAKAMTQFALSYVPRGDDLNYQLQRRVTHSLPISDAVLVENIETAQGHLDAVGSYLQRPLGEAVFYEFGAGWSLAMAFALSALGVGRQILVDVRPLTRPALLVDTIERLPAVAASIGVELELPPWPDEPDLVTALRTYGIDYRAPCDARATGLEAGTVDVVTSTSTLEHIPTAEVVPILVECRRLLRPGGVVSAWVDYKDHYASFDERISSYNFLTFDARTWRWYSPPLHHQNRLRHRNYLDLFEQAGFELAQVDVVAPSPEDLTVLASLDLDPSFASFSDDELGIRDGRFLAVPKA